jgi:hypothetical protein
MEADNKRELISVIVARFGRSRYDFDTVPVSTRNQAANSSRKLMLTTNPLALYSAMKVNRGVPPVPATMCLANTPQQLRASVLMALHP